MPKEKTRYKYGDYIIRQIKGRYYVYKLENVGDDVKEHYVGSLADVVETYIKLKDGIGGVGESPTTPGAGFEPARGRSTLALQASPLVHSGTPALIRLYEMLIKIIKSN